jgi:hypothetical protein
MTMAPRDLAIDAYRSILEQYEPLRQFGNFINLFNDEKDDSIPDPIPIDSDLPF